MDLNIDCHLLILESLELRGLLSLAETNKHFANLAVNVYRRKFASKTVTIVTPFTTNKNLLYYYFAQLRDDGITIQYMDAVSQMLKHFGHLIPNLHLQYAFHYTDEYEEINKLINLYCVETLTSITIQIHKKSFFDSFTKPFKRVENVEIYGDFNTLGNYELSFNQLFPAMRRLYLGDVKVLDRSCIDHEFPHLEDLTVYLATSNELCFNEAETEKLITKNPQIKNLKLISSSQSLLRFVAKHLPNLERLTLVWYQEKPIANLNVIEMHFENLKTFRMEEGSHSMPINITFGNLVEFESDIYPKDCSRWLDFVVRDKNLKRLQVIGIEDRLEERLLSNVEILRLAAARTNLNEISFKCEENVKDESIVKLIENTKQLKILKLEKDVYGMVNPRSFVTTAKILQTKIGGEWSVHETEWEIELKRNEWM